MNDRHRLLLLTGLACLVSACGQDTAETKPPGEPPATAMTRSPAPPGAAVFFITPMDGATVTSPVPVKFGISGMSVAPAGDATPGTGHHHLLIDAELGDPAQPVPNDDQHRHFGKGQTEVSLDLPPGQHTLQLVLGDGNHIPHDPPVKSGRITITVE
jgi:hypothetical protein